MTSVLLYSAAWCRAVRRSAPICLSRSAPLFNKTCMTSVLLMRATPLSVVSPNISTLSTGTPSSSSSFNKLTSSSRAVRVKRKMSSLSISKREMEVTMKQFDVCETHFTTHSNQLHNFVQRLMQVTAKSFWVDIKLPVHNNSRLFLQIKVCNNHIKQSGLIFVNLYTYQSYLI